MLKHQLQTVRVSDKLLTASGHRPLHLLAALPDSAKIMKIFVKKHIQLNALSEDGMTPLDLAIKYNNKEAAKVLLAAGGRTKYYDNKDKF